MYDWEPVDYRDYNYPVPWSIVLKQLDCTVNGAEEYHDPSAFDYDYTFYPHVEFPMNVVSKVPEWRTCTQEGWQALDPPYALHPAMMPSMEVPASQPDPRPTSPPIIPPASSPSSVHSGGRPGNDGHEVGSTQGIHDSGAGHGNPANGANHPGSHQTPSNQGSGPGSIGNGWSSGAGNPDNGGKDPHSDPQNSVLHQSLPGQRQGSQVGNDDGRGDPDSADPDLGDLGAIGHEPHPHRPSDMNGNSDWGTSSISDETQDLALGQDGSAGDPGISGMDALSGNTGPPKHDQEEQASNNRTQAQEMILTLRVHGLVEY